MTIIRGLPELRKLYELMEQVCALFDRRCRKQTVLDKTHQTEATPEPADSELVILCVTGSPQVEAVLTGATGVISALKPGTIVVDGSTALPESTVRMAGQVAKAGGRFLDAPMTRLAKQAHEGTLNILVGGETDAIKSEGVGPMASALQAAA